MSQLLQIAARGGGGVLTGDSTIPPAFVDQGIPYSSGGRVAVDSVSAIDRHYQSLPFTAVGRLAIASNSVVNRFASGGIPFDVNGRVVIGSGAITRYNTGIPYTATGQIKAG